MVTNKIKSPKPPGPKLYLNPPKPTPSSHLQYSSCQVVVHFHQLLPVCIAMPQLPGHGRLLLATRHSDRSWTPNAQRARRASRKGEKTQELQVPINGGTDLNLIRFIFGCLKGMGKFSLHLAVYPYSLFFLVFGFIHLDGT